MTLANGIAGMLLLGGVSVGLLCLVAAVVIETPLLRLWWRRTGLWRWVLGANVASLAVGLLPAILWNVYPRPGETVDPWQWHQTVLLKALLLCGGVFIATVVVEALIYGSMPRSSTNALRFRRIVTATLAVNAISYAPMVAYLVVQARSTGDFELLPDTAWVAGDTASLDELRVYFVDQESDQLHSIRLDGSDRRLELDDPLGRFEGSAATSCIYALFEGDPRILFGGPDEHWHVRDGDTARQLNARVQIDWGLASPGNTASSLQPAIAEAGLVSRPLVEDQNRKAAYLSSCTEFDWICKVREIGEYQIRSGTSPYSGAGRGLTFKNTRSGERLNFRIWAGFLSLACNNPVVLPDANTVVFRCGHSIMVMNFAKRRVGRLVRGDSLLMKLPQFSEVDAREAVRPEASTRPSVAADLVLSIEPAEETLCQARSAGLDYAELLR